MTRLRALIAAAAALVATVGVGLALQQAGQSLGWTCAEWAEHTEEWRDTQRNLRAIVAIKQGATIPKFVTGGLLGDCGGGICISSPAGCGGGRLWSKAIPVGEVDAAVSAGYEVEGSPCEGAPGVKCYRAYRRLGGEWDAALALEGWDGSNPWGSAVAYHYSQGPLVDLGAPGSWRIYEVRAPLPILGWWKAAATASPATIRFYGGFGEAVTACRAVTSAANCLALFDADRRCWLLDTGETCSYGRLYGPGKGGDQPCDYARVRAPMPCVVDRGAGSELIDAARVLTAEDLQ